MTAPTLLLNDGNRIPQIGLGTWPLKDDEVAALSALDTGADRGVDSDKSGH